MTGASTEETVLIDRANSGDQNALEELLLGVEDMVFNLSLRMLGLVADAEDASQEILLRVVQNLPGFRKESAFSTWVFRIAVNFLLDYKKHLFAKQPLNFGYYGSDIRQSGLEELPDLSQGVDKTLLSEELKLSCTNVMLQCLEPENRCIFVLGTMFHIDSKTAGEALNLSPEAYRKRLSRVRQTVAAFLGEYCGLGGGECSCGKRIHYAIQTHRLNPAQLEFSQMTEAEKGTLYQCKEAMEEMDDLSGLFSTLPAYRTPQNVKNFLTRLLSSQACRTIQNASG